jgi:hypothetical protein
MTIINNRCSFFPFFQCDWKSALNGANAKLALTLMVAAIAIAEPTPARSLEFVPTSTFDSIVAQRSLTSPNLQVEPTPPPPVDSRPSDRPPAGTYVVPSVERWEEAF